MQISLKGTHALIGGSSKGIGRAVAEELARSGARVTLVARSEALLKDLVKKLNEATGKTHSYLALDYKDLSGYQEAISA